MGRTSPKTELHHALAFMAAGPAARRSVAEIRGERLEAALTRLEERGLARWVTSEVVDDLSPHYRQQRRRSAFLTALGRAEAAS